ncbi:MAG: transposase [Labilithrix sp.]|nr:transposase [Labilithrix sp.]
MFEHIREEFRGAALGDARRSARLERIGEALSRDPGCSFPEAMGSEAQLEALYRFLNNDAVTIGDVVRPHTSMTSSRCRSMKDVLVLHDTTSFEFTGTRQGLGRLHAKAARQGFFLHASLAVSPAREPLGIVAAETWARRGQARGRANMRIPG